MRRYRIPSSALIAKSSFKPRLKKYKDKKTTTAPSASGGEPRPDEYPFPGNNQSTTIP
jgi:hypothetical protein